MCSLGLGDEMHMLFECEALRDLWKVQANLFRASVKEFMW